ncbi:CGH_1_collapsed_G0056730.mRNA.1.CDS.1 [Saccharomyces cerevisiae]|nr:CGH_1_collapsed_G0056730.mRNA.1.CDS.1 [Saccharomyces cerevisiae]
MQTISGVLPTVLSPSELRSDDERTFQFDEEAEITTHLTESEDLRRLINETAQLGVRVDHIHDKTDQEIARLEKVIKEVTESDTFSDLVLAGLKPIRIFLTVKAVQIRS